MTTFHQWQLFGERCPNCGAKLERHTKDPHKFSVGEHVACPNCESQGVIASDVPFRIDWTADDCDYD